jgi:hypothetical protein
MRAPGFCVSLDRRKMECHFRFLSYFHSEGSFIVSWDEQNRGERRRLSAKLSAANGLGCAGVHGEVQLVQKTKNKHEYNDMRPTCFGNWKIRGFCGDECQHMEACMKESTAVLPLEAWRLIGEFEPRPQLGIRGKFSAWERRVKKLKK